MNLSLTCPPIKVSTVIKQLILETKRSEGKTKSSESVKKTKKKTSPERAKSTRTSSKTVEHKKKIIDNWAKCEECCKWRRLVKSTFILFIKRL